MNENIEKLMYDAGLTADGCFGDMDKYDQEAVMRVIDLTIKKCANLCQDLTNECELNPYQLMAVDACIYNIKNHFGLI